MGVCQLVGCDSTREVGVGEVQDVRLRVGVWRLVGDLQERNWEKRDLFLSLFFRFLLLLFSGLFVFFSPAESGK